MHMVGDWYQPFIASPAAQRSFHIAAVRAQRSISGSPIHPMPDKTARCSCSAFRRTLPIKNTIVARHCCEMSPKRPFTMSKSVEFQTGRSLRQHRMSQLRTKPTLENSRPMAACLVLQTQRNTPCRTSDFCFEAKWQVKEFESRPWSFGMIVCLGLPV